MVTHLLCQLTSGWGNSYVDKKWGPEPQPKTAASALYSVGENVLRNSGVYALKCVRFHYSGVVVEKTHAPLNCLQMECEMKIIARHTFYPTPNF